MDMKCFGVYALVFHSERGDMVYIGSTAQTFEQRQYEHLSTLKRDKHGNKYLQRLWNKYGKFYFEIVEVCSDRNTVSIREQWWMEHYDKSKLINIAPAFPSPRFGVPVSDETRAKMSLSAKIRMSRPEELEQLRLRATGKSPSAETRKKLSDASSKFYNTPEGKAFMAQIGKNRVVSEETKLKLSLANRGRSPAPQTIEAVRQAHLGKSTSAETRKKMSDSHRKRIADAKADNTSG